MSISRFTACFVLGGFGFVASGCATWFSNNTTTAGASPFHIDYETVDLVNLLDPKATVPSVGIDGSTLSEGARIDIAFQRYHVTNDSKSPDAQVASRNQIQERLLGASNQLCHQYQQYMQNVNSSGNFALGVLTTATAAAGALVSGGASQILAGSAAALSGTRAEFNQDYFYDVTVATIFDGINARREASYEKIKKDRQTASISDYSIETAVKDTITYHSNCSLVAGVQELGDSVKLAKDPGLDQLARAYMKVNILQDIATRKSTNPADLLGHDAVGVEAATALGVGDNSAASDLRDDPIAAHGLLQQSISNAMQDFVQRISQTDRWPDKAKTKDYPKLIDDKAAARAALAVTQLGQCQKKITDAASAIAEARFNAAKAADEANKASAQATLDARILEGRARVSEMTPAAAWLREDLSWLRTQVDAAEKIAVTKNEASMSTDALDKALTDFAARPQTGTNSLACAEPPAAAAPVAPVVTEPATPPSQ